MQQNNVELIKELYRLVPKDAANPNWETLNLVHDWKSYIHPALQLIWNVLPFNVKNEFAANAQWLANQEEYD
jgi:hypothetical protein